jgi:hypothetical protein
MKIVLENIGRITIYTDEEYEDGPVSLDWDSETVNRVINEMGAAASVVPAAPAPVPPTRTEAVSSAALERATTAQQRAVVATALSHAGPVAPEDYAARLVTGSHALSAMVEAWLVGWNCPRDAQGKPTVAQPDRRKLLGAAMAANGKAIFAYIAEHGGLRHAVALSTPEDAAPADVPFRSFCDDIAGNIAQLASIDSPPLAECIEYFQEDTRG